jgi:hypothetical protein
MMSGKSRKVLTVALAVSVMFSAQAAVSSAFAAAVKKPVAAKPAVKAPVLKVNTVKIQIDGQAVPVQTVVAGGLTWVSVRDLAVAFGGTIGFDADKKMLNVKNESVALAVAAGSKDVYVNTVKQTIANAPRMIEKKWFMEINNLVELLGGEVIEDLYGKKEFASQKLQEGLVHPHFLNSNTLLVSKETETGYDHFMLNLATRKLTKLNLGVDTDNLYPSPDGNHIAFTDENSNVYILSLNTIRPKAKRINAASDDTIKAELNWATDSKSIFYLQGERTDVIANIDLAGKITRVVDDKVIYKSDLQVSLDGKQFLYAVTKQSKVTVDSTKPLEEDAVVIDDAGTEPQLFTFNTTVKDAKAVAQTTTIDNKTFPSLLADGTVAYVSTDMVKEDAISGLKLIGKDLKVSDLSKAGVDILSSTLLNGKLIALGYTAKDDKQFIYEIDPANGAVVALAETPTDVTGLLLGASKSEVLVEFSSGQLAVWKNNKWFAVSN